MSELWIELSEKESWKRQTDLDREWCCPYWEQKMKASPCDDCGMDCKNLHACMDNK